LPFASPNYWLSESRMIGLIRLVLAAAGLVIIYLVPEEPDRLVEVTYTALILYTLYSAVVYGLELAGRLPGWAARWGHWVDVGCYTLLITLSHGTNSVFFFGYFLPILVASFRWGFASGIRVVLVSTVLFTGLGYLTAPVGPEFEAQRFLIRPIYLLTLGYMMAYWGGYEIELKRRLALLRDAATLSNPRFGADRTLGQMMHRLRVFFGADTCAMILQDLPTHTSTLRRARQHEPAEPEQPVRAETIPSEVAEILMGLPPEHVVRYRVPMGFRWLGGSLDSQAFEATTGADAELDTGAAGAIADVLDASSFISVPLRFRNRVTGRLYLTGDGKFRSGESDARFLLQVMDQVLPLVDDLRLVNQLATAAAEEERRRIARDIHDSVIQPYIGLQIGLTGVRQKLMASGSELTADMDRLIEMTNIGVEDLRRQVLVLREGVVAEGRLVPATKRFAAKFSDVTGIAVEVEAETDFPLDGRLASEAFQMIVEGLSNVRRHTQSVHATIGLALRDGYLQVRIENENAEPRSVFTPRSITERAAALGGEATVYTSEMGSTVVTVEVPL
jgi:signal transduction histidine kinase